MKPKKSAFVVLLALSALILMQVSFPFAATRTNIFWAHGNLAIPGNADKCSIFFSGTGANIYGEGQQWIHIPITTPQVTESTAVLLKQILVKFVTTNDSQVLEFALHDGEDEVQRSTHIVENSDPNTNFYPFPSGFDHQIKSGLNLSILVDLGYDDNWSSRPMFTLIATGAEFERSW